jgi:SAM-dependent methyltransferase
MLTDFKQLPEHIRKQIDYFEAEDDTREAYALEPWQSRYVNAFLRYGKPKKGGVIIDNATGSGYMAIELAKRGFFVIACDLTMKELVTLSREINRMGLQGRALLVCANSESLPIKDECADGMVANAILEHLPNEKTAIESMTNILKKGASLMLAMPLSFRYIFPLLMPMNFIHDKRIGHLRRYHREDILNKFTGFSERTTYYTGHVVKVLCLFMFLLTKISWWNELGELLDKKFSALSYGASNIVTILQKK